MKFLFIIFAIIGLFAQFGTAHARLLKKDNENEEEEEEEETKIEFANVVAEIQYEDDSEVTFWALHGDPDDDQEASFVFGVAASDEQYPMIMGELEDLPPPEDPEFDFVETYKHLSKKDKAPKELERANEKFKNKKSKKEKRNLLEEERRGLYYWEGNIGPFMTEEGWNGWCDWVDADECLPWNYSPLEVEWRATGTKAVGVWPYNALVTHHVVEKTSDRHTCYFLWWEWTCYDNFRERTILEYNIRPGLLTLFYIYSASNAYETKSYFDQPVPHGYHVFGVNF